MISISGQPAGGPGDGIGAEASGSPAGEQTDGLDYGYSAYRRVTRPGRSSCPNSDRTEAHGRPCLRWKDGEHSFARGTGGPWRGAATGEEAEAKAEAEKPRPGLAMFTDGGRGCRIRVVWRTANPGWASKLTWVATRRPATQSALPSQGRWNRLQEGRQPQSRSQYSRMPKPPSDGWLWRSLSLAQKHVLQARKHIAVLRRSRPDITIGIRWCPAHKGVAGNERADEWAKLAAEEPDARGVEWLSYLDRTEVRAMPLPRSS